MIIVFNSKTSLSKNKRVHCNEYRICRDNVLSFIKRLRMRHFIKFSQIKKVNF